MLGWCRLVLGCDAVGMTDGSKVKVGLHQESALSFFMFAMVMGGLKNQVRQESSWWVLTFADDIVICK